MQVTISGYTGRPTSTADVPRKDGTGYFPISDTSVAVRVTEDNTDWYQLKFIGDALVKAASFLSKGSLISVTGDLTFESWNDDDGELRAKAVVTISEIQLPSKSQVI